MKTLFRVITILIVITLCNSCKENHSETHVTDIADTTATKSIQNQGDTLATNNIKVYPLQDSPLFNDAILTLNTPAEKEILSTDKVHFAYDIKNYPLAKPTTEGSCAIECANSSQGQHIHLILNNQPYLAKYTPEFDETLSPGHYVALSFLSRSYHESIKHYEAFDLRQFTIGEVKGEEVDLTQPMLFYSRPKGEYKGRETKKILLDFYVVNAILGVNDYSVRVTIDGNVFLLKSWKGYLIEGLSMGEHTVTIELLDKTGNLVKGPYSQTKRKIKLLPEVN